MKAQTIILQPRGEAGLEGVLKEAANRLAEGGIVALPTETVYGLAADARSDEAVSKVFAAKGRPSDNPLIVHVDSTESAKALAKDFPPVAERLAERFWPGPLTLVLTNAGHVAPAVSCGLPTIAVRVPSHPIFLGVLRNCGFPLAAPSANLSGRPSPTTAQHVVADLNGIVPIVVDGGPSSVGIESTVVDVTGPEPRILRLGGLSVEDIEREIGPVMLALGDGETPTSPGQKYKHYAPKAELVVIFGSQERTLAAIRERLAMARVAGKKVGLWVPPSMADLPADMVIRQESDAAANLYAALRAFDDAGVGVILAVGLPERGLGRTGNERLRRAASLLLDLDD